MKDFYYLTSVDSTAELIDAMTEAAKEVKYETLVRKCADLAQWEKLMGYGPWLRLKDDPYVRFYRSTYDGRPCYYIDHSAIEHIWTRRD